MGSDLYEHGRKAGNEGDVVKHAILLDVIDEAISKRDSSSQPFWYVDTHCARAYHRLAITGGWTKGIGKIRKRVEELPRVLREYADFCFYKDDPAALRKTAFTGLATRLYLGSSALVYQRMLQSAAQERLWMTLFDTDIDVVTQLFSYYSDQNQAPSLAGFSTGQYSAGNALAAMWEVLGESRCLIVKGQRQFLRVVQRHLLIGLGTNA